MTHVRRRTAKERELAQERPTFVHRPQVLRLLPPWSERDMSREVEQHFREAKRGDT